MTVLSILAALVAAYFLIRIALKYFFPPESR